MQNQVAVDVVRQWSADLEKWLGVEPRATGDMRRSGVAQVLGTIAGENDPHLVDAVRQLLSSRRGKDAFARVASSVSAEDNGGLLVLLRRSNYRALVLGLAAVRASDRRELLELARELAADGRAIATFGEVLAWPLPEPHVAPQREMAPDLLPRWQAAVQGLIAARRLRNPVADRCLTELLQSYRSTDAAKLLRLVGSQALAEDPEAAVKLWGMWNERPTRQAIMDIVPWVSPVSNASVCHGFAALIRRPNAEAIIGQLAGPPAWNCTSNLLQLLATFERANDWVAQERFWEMWADEPEIVHFFPVAADDETHRAVTSILHRSNYRETMLQIMAVPLWHDRTDNLRIVGSDAFFNNPDAATIYWKLWNDDACRRALVGACRNPAGSAHWRSYIGPALVNVLRLPDAEELVNTLATADADVRIAACKLLTVEFVAGDDELTRWICRSTLDPTSLVARLGTRVPPDEAPGFARVVRQRRIDELMLSSPAYADPHVVTEGTVSAPTGQLSKRDVRDWRWQCRTVSSWDALSATAPQFATTLDSMSVTDAPALQNRVLDALARLGPMSARQIVAGFGCIGDVGVQARVLHAIAVAEEAHGVVSSIPDFVVSTTGGGEVERTPASLRRMTTRIVLRSIVADGDCLLESLRRRPGSDLVLASATAVLEAAGRLDLGDAGENLHHAVHEPERALQSAPVARVPAGALTLIPSSVATATVRRRMQEDRDGATRGCSIS